MLILRKLSLILLSLLLFSSCSDELEPIRDGEWLIVPPASVGLDGEKLLQARQRAENIDRLRSLLVVKEGNIVMEHYRLLDGKASLMDVRSVTKSVVGTLALIAEDQGYVSSLQDPIGRYLPDSLGLSPDQQAVKISDLLSMRSGFEWLESGPLGYTDWINAPDQLQYLLDRPITSLPGTAFSYNSAAVHLLGIILEYASGMELEDFAEQYLFEPLNIERVAWEYLSGPYVNGGAGLDMRTRDLAKLGMLYLQEGTYQGQRLISPAHIQDALRVQAGVPGRLGPIRDYSYGYLWWIIHAPVPAFMASGYGGQLILGFPEWDMVVITTADYNNLGNEEPEFNQSLLSLVFNDILAAVE
jgi:CubicO group peptidase (beta-lactamase class C family)